MTIHPTTWWNSLFLIDQGLFFFKDTIACTGFWELEHFTVQASSGFLYLNANGGLLSLFLSWYVMQTLRVQNSEGRPTAVAEAYDVELISYGCVTAFIWGVRWYFISLYSCPGKRIWFSSGSHRFSSRPGPSQVHHVSGRFNVTEQRSAL